MQRTQIFKGSFLLSLLICLFAIGSWIDLNGVWVELPLLVTTLPERWTLPTIVVTIVQLANIAPLIYMGLFYIGRFQNMERYTIYVILSIGCVCCGLLAVFWDYTMKLSILGKKSEYSVAFFVLVWFLSMIDTTSSVTFLPYLVHYPRYYITALYVGEGLSGFFPGILGLIQGVGGEGRCENITISLNGTQNYTQQMKYPAPRISVSSFFVFLCAMLVISLVSFIILDNCKYFHKFRLQNVSKNSKGGSEKEFLLKETETSITDKMKSSLLGEQPKKSKRKWIIYILLVGYINFLTNGVLPSIQNYSLMPYSNNLYHIVVSVSQILNPLACLLTLRSWKINNIILGAITTVASIGAGYVLFLASMSPVPILNITPFGQILAAFSWFIVSILFSFEKAILAIELQKQGHVWLQLCGASTQIGSALGAALIFVLVVVINIFKPKPEIC